MGGAEQEEKGGGAVEVQVVAGPPAEAHTLPTVEENEPQKEGDKLSFFKRAGRRLRSR